MKPKKSITFCPSSVAIEAAEGALPKFSTLAYTGGPLRVGGYDLPVVIDLAGLDTTTSNIVANLDHDPQQRVGHVESVTNDRKQLRLAGVVSATSDAAKEFIASAKNQFPWQASVEAVPTSNLQRIEAGQTVSVNGQTIDGPCLVARRSRLRAVAFLSRPADDKTSVTVAASAADSQGDDSMNDFEKWVEAQGITIATISATAREALQARYDLEQHDKKKKDMMMSAPPFDLDGVIVAAEQANATIEAKLAEFEPQLPADKLAKHRADATKNRLAAKQKAIAEKWSTDKAALEFERVAVQAELAMMRDARPTGPAIHASGSDGSDLKVIEAALCQTRRLKDHEKGYDDKTLQAAHTRFRGRIGLQEAIILAAAANGHHVRPGERLHVGNLREVLKAACQPVPINAAFSTLSLPGVLSNVANKELLQGYMEEDQTWREIARVTSVNDFKTVTSYRMLDNMTYEELAPDGRMKHGSVDEESFTRSAKTYAKMFSLTRVDIINDDLSAFDDIRSRLGRGAAKKFNDVFWTAFIGSSTLFPTDNSLTNYISGSTTTLLTDGVGLGLAVKAFRKMTSPSADGTKRVGNGMTPVKLLVPPELEAAAEGLYRNQNLGQVATSSANIYANKYRPVVQNRLSDSGFTGYSTTAWYLLCDPGIRAPMVVSFLNGVETPTVESADADFDQLGIQFRGYHDFGCDEAEYLVGIKSKGAA